MWYLSTSIRDPGPCSMIKFLDWATHAKVRKMVQPRLPPLWLTNARAQLWRPIQITFYNIYLPTLLHPSTCHFITADVHFLIFFFVNNILLWLVITDSPSCSNFFYFTTPRIFMITYFLSSFITYGFIYFLYLPFTIINLRSFFFFLLFLNSKNMRFISLYFS